MANKKPIDHKFIIASKKGVAEARRAFESDNEKRILAGASGKLLKPDDISGQYDVSRALLTTMGGKPRMLTINDLRQFDHITKQVSGKFKKGITAKGVIDLSLPVDRKRANDEIRSAVPISTTGSQIKFMTDTGPKSDRDRHYVVVNLVNFMPVVASAIKADKTGQELSKSPLQISCSCGRWRYWLAYLATKGGYNSGHVEDAFPKIKNPGLAGVACKHILRVMGLVSQSPFIKQYMSNMVKKARDRVEYRREDEKVANTRAMAEKMKKEQWRQRQIRTTDEKRAERTRIKEKKSLQDASKKAPRLARKPTATRRIEAAIASGKLSEADLSVLRKFNFTDKQIAEKLGM